MKALEDLSQFTLEPGREEKSKNKHMAVYSTNMTSSLFTTFPSFLNICILIDSRMYKLPME